MKLTIRMLRRDFSTPLVPPDVMFEPVRYSWNALGGPEMAEIRAVGSQFAVWSLCDWLRAPIEIIDERGTAVWWGYVAEVTVGTGAVELGLSLENMANRVAVRYQNIVSGSPVTITTDWLEDEDSVAEFGNFEYLANMTSGSAEAAIGLQERILNEMRYPISVIRHTSHTAELTATIRCRGWWSSLAWQYYANENPATATTTAQIAAILAAKAQFITGSDILVTGDISLSQYQDGSGTCTKIIEDLLAIGLASGTRLQATVTRDREVRLTEESLEDQLFLQADGMIRNLYNNPLLQHTCPVGQWCLLRDVIQPTIDVVRMTNPTRFFVQRSEFTAESWSLIMEPRGRGGPWEILNNSPSVSGMAAGTSYVLDSGNGGETWVGRKEGPHAGLFAIENQDDASWSVLLQAADTANVPFVSAGERNYVPNSKWLRLGYADALHIKLRDSAGSSTDPEDHPDIEVPAAACTITDTGEHFAGSDVEAALQELGATIAGITTTDNGLQADSAGAFYLGDPTTDGTWRIVRSGNDLRMERRESSAWVLKQTITA
jgi:hypothetical protein